MPKCQSCKKKDASYCDPKTNKRKWCRDCKDPEALTKYAVKKKNKASIPVNFDELPMEPRIIARLGNEWFGKFVSIEELKESVGPKKKGNSKTSKLDVSTGTNLEQTAIQIGRHLCGDAYERMHEITGKVARCMQINQEPILGFNYDKNVTRKHMHAPMGVLNLLGDGMKQWRLWAPQTKDKNVSPTILNQYAGDLLWLPAGWFHEVWTLGGSQVDGDTLARHWASWCLPRHMTMRPLAGLLVDDWQEEQKKEQTITKKKKRMMYDILVKYVDN